MVINSLSPDIYCGDYANLIEALDEDNSYPYFRTHPVFALASLSLLQDERIIELARLSIAEHLKKEDLSISDAEFIYAFQDGLKKSTIYFKVKEHQVDYEYYVVTCRNEKCIVTLR
ncbi:hypothetical protein ACWX0P_27465 [Vibrio mediterranei]